MWFSVRLRSRIGDRWTESERSEDEVLSEAKDRCASVCVGVQVMSARVGDGRGVGVEDRLGGGYRKVSGSARREGVCGSEGVRAAVLEGGSGV